MVQEKTNMHCHRHQNMVKKKVFPAKKSKNMGFVMVQVQESWHSHERSNQITFIVTSPQHKCLGEWNSYERAPDSAEKQQTIYIWTDSAKKQQTIYIWTDSAKKQQTIYIWTDSAKKQQQFTYGQYIFTDCTEDNVQNTHTYTHIHIVYYKDILNYQRHIIHRMGTSTLCTVSIHNVVYA